MKILVAGASYTGRFLAAHFLEHEIHFLSRSNVEAEGLLAYNENDLYDAVLDTVPALPSGLPYAEVFQQAGRLIHLSSTSVLPERFSASTAEGLPVLDESTLPAPETERGARRLVLEERIRSEYPQACIIRCGGIYGPDRGLVQQFLRGDFSRAESNRMVSRIHVYDLCQLILACVDQNTPPLVHGVDLKSSLNAEVFSFLEEALGISVPGPWRGQGPSGRAVRSLFAQQLVSYRYPTFREGFADAIAAFRGGGRSQ